MVVASAHRTPEAVMEWATSARERGIEVIIAAAGGSAGLPGVVASWTTLPVIGVPVPSSDLEGIDSLYSIAQMPPGIPVACVAIGSWGARKRGIPRRSDTRHQARLSARSVRRVSTGSEDQITRSARVIERYTRPRMGTVWSERNKYDRWLQVELAVCGGVDRARHDSRFRHGEVAVCDIQL